MQKLLMLLCLIISTNMAATIYNRKAETVNALEVIRANLATIESELGASYIGLMDNSVDSDLRLVYYNGTGDRRTLKLGDYLVNMDGKFYKVSKESFENDFVIP